MLPCNVKAVPCLKKAMLVGTVLLSGYPVMVGPALAGESQQVSENLRQGEQLSACQATQSLKEPIAIVLQHDWPESQWSDKAHQPILTYGDVDEFGENSEVIFLMPAGGELTDDDMAAIKGKGFGRRLFWRFVVPAITREVVESYLDQNTTSFTGSRTPSSVNESQIRFLTREVCLDMTWGFGEAFGICDFFGDLADQVYIRVRRYFQNR